MTIKLNKKKYDTCPFLTIIFNITVCAGEQTDVTIGD